MGLAAGAGADHHFVAPQRFDHQGHHGRRVSVVGIDEDDVLARCLGDAGAHRLRLAAVGRVLDQPDVVAAGHFGRRVRRAVVDDEDLGAVVDGGEQLVQHDGQALLFVISRDHDRGLDAPAAVQPGCRRL